MNLKLYTKARTGRIRFKNGILEIRRHGILESHFNKTSGGSYPPKVLIPMPCLQKITFCPAASKGWGWLRVDYSVDGLSQESTLRFNGKQQFGVKIFYDDLKLTLTNEGHTVIWEHSSQEAMDEQAKREAEVKTEMSTKLDPNVTTTGGGIAGGLIGAIAGGSVGGTIMLVGILLCCTVIGMVPGVILVVAGLIIGIVGIFGGAVTGGISGVNGAGNGTLKVSHF